MPLARNAKIVVTRRLPGRAVERLRENHNVTIHEKLDKSVLSEDELIALLRDADGVLSMLSDPFTARVFDSCSRLRAVAQYAVGYDNIDLEAAAHNRVVVTHTPGVLTDATADMTFALLLAVSRNILSGDHYVRSGQFRRWETDVLLGVELRGKTIGIVGMGRIGLAVARRARGFGMNVIYHNRNQVPLSVEYVLGARIVTVDELLKRSDFVSIHCPLTERSRHLFSSAAFDRMKSSAYLINTARGAIVDEAALVAALDSGKIAGAALDVFEDEPEVHPGLIASDRAVLAPHLGSATKETRARMADMCVDSMLAALNRAEHVPYRLV